MTNITYRALHNITPDDAQRLNTNLDTPWPVSGSQTLAHYGKDELADIAKRVNIWAHPETTEETPWELENEQPPHEEPLPLALTALAIAIPSALLLTLTTLL